MSARLTTDVIRRDIRVIGEGLAVMPREDLCHVHEIGLHGKEGEAVGRGGFGIHGTIRPEEIGKAASRGCIRLHNKDVAVLYDLLAEGQSFVWVED